MFISHIITIRTLLIQVKVNLEELISKQEILTIV